MKTKVWKYTCLLIIPIIFLLVSIITLSDYGINWDEPLHFNRGQAYLNYLLFGRKNYLDLPSYPKPKGASDFMGKEGEQDLYLNLKSSELPSDLSYRRSYFLSDVFNYDYFIKNDGYGHPPTNDILASASNYIFYHKLGILGDIEAYHLFEVVSVFLLVAAVSIFSFIEFGFFASIVSSLVLSSYPLFFSESHFNIKDPPQAAFYGIAIIFFYFSIKKSKWYLIICSSISAGLALGTKFNVIFIPFILAPWFLLFLKQNFRKFFESRKLLFSTALYPVITLFVFFIFWPYLWRNPVGHFAQVLKFYKDVGTASTGELDQYIYHGFNIFAPLWIIITTPLPVLFLVVVGIVSSLLKVIRQKQPVFLLILAWLFLPILRVMLPGTTIFSGVRHILEFLPALAIVAGVGAKTLYDISNKFFIKFFFVICLIVSSVFVVLEIARLHPNENVYFNQLVGGLAGARDKNIPYWGYNYGNVYLQGVNWLNVNAEPNAKLGLAIVNMVNVPRLKLRDDIDFSNSYPSGSVLQGEYVMEMSNQWGPKIMYSYLYYDTYLNPVYEVKVDGVTLLTIWKNDREHLKKGFEKEIEYIPSNIKIDKNILTVDLGKEVVLTKIKISHSDVNCDKQKGGYVMLSLDKTNWKQEPETIDYPQIPVQWLGVDKNTFVFLFVAKKMRYLYLDTQMTNSCTLKNAKISLFGLK